MKTRSTKQPTANAAESVEEPATNGSSLEASTNNPPLLFILPQAASPDARVVTLPNPASSSPTRYFFCPDKGIYEFTKIAAPKKTPRSWLIAPDHSRDKEQDSMSIVSPGYSIENADLFVATPMDPLFILLPALIPPPDSHEQLFQNVDDYLNTLAEKSKHLNQLLRTTKLQESFEKRANAICDNVDMGHEKLYRLSNQKLLGELLKKAQRMAANGLPASMENHFVQEALRVPITPVQRTEFQDEALPIAETTTSQSQSTEPTPSTPSLEITHLLRTRISLTLLLSTYIPTTLHAPLLSLLSDFSSPISFTPLDNHLTHIATLKRQAQALSSLSDNISRKRSAFNDEEAEERQAEKKRKKEEEDAKKKNTSRGVKALGKVDTSGMKKLSSFFMKK